MAALRTLARPAPRKRREREALLLDLGALVYELHRQGRRAPELLQEKAIELGQVDREVRALEDALRASERLPARTAASPSSRSQLVCLDAAAAWR